MSPSSCRVAVLLGVFVTGLLLAPAAAAQPLQATHGVGATSATPEAHVRLSWAPSGTAGELYQLNRARVVAGVPTNDQILAVRPETDTEYLDATARPGVTYEYCLRALTAGTAASCARGSRVLRRPGSLGASDSTRVDGVVLEWLDLSSVEVGYVVFRGAVGAPQTVAGMTPIDTTTADATGYLDDSAVTLEASQYCIGLLDGSGGIETVAEPLACDVGTRGAVLPPGGVAASDGTLGDRVRVAWASRPNVLYTVYRSAAGQPRQPLVSAHPDSPYDDLTAVEGTAYTYCVTASTDVGESVRVCDAGRRGALAPPTEVAAADGTSDGGVALTWVDPGPTETGFRIFRALAGGTAFDLVATVAANRTQYTDRSGAPDELYDYCVAAIAEATVDGVAVTAESARGCDPGHFVAILPPVEFAATDAATGNEGFVELTWESASESVQLFQVYRDGTPIATLPPFARSYRDATGLSGTPYDYRVQAVTVIGVDPDAITQGLAPVFSRAEAERSARAAARGAARAAGPAAVARLDAQAADAETALVADIEALLAGLGVDAASRSGALGSSEIRRADSPELEAIRLLRAPTGLVATTALEDRVQITWTDQSDIETDYEIRATHSAGASPTVTRTRIGPNRDTFDDFDAPTGTDVTYEVRVVDSDPEAVAPPESGSAWVPVTGRRVLLPPGDLEARQVTVEEELLVTWRDSSRAETGYTLTAALAAGPLTLTTEANARQAIVPIQPADFGTSILVTVQTVAPDVPTDLPSRSAEATVTVVPTLLAPRVMTASTGYADRIVVSWTDDSGANTGYRVTRDGATIGQPTATTYVDGSPTGPADYCVTPTGPGGGAAEPAPVCAMGTLATVTVAGTGDVVTTGASLQTFGSAGTTFGSALAASDGQAVVGGPGASIEVVQGTVADWAVPWNIGVPYVGGFEPGGPGYPPGGVRSDVGAAAFYARSAAGWSQSGEPIRIQPGTPFTYGRFGADVDVEGNNALVGAPGEAEFHNHPFIDLDEINEGITYIQTSIEFGDGGAYVYSRSNPSGEWARVALLRSRGYPNNELETSPDGWGIGYNQSLLDLPGVTSYIINPYIGRNPIGALGFLVYAGQQSGSRMEPIRRTGELVALSNEYAFASFVENGDTKVGRYQANEGYVWKGSLPGPAGFDTSPSGSGSLAATDGAVAIGSGADNQVHLHQVSATGVTTAPVVLSGSGEFGSAVELEGGLLAVGAPGANTVRLYEKAAGFVWTLTDTLTPEVGVGDTRFGESLSITDGLIVVGARKAGTPGVVYTFRPEGAGFVLASRLTLDPTAGTSESVQFGAAVAASADDVLIGAPGGLGSSSVASGAVFVATVGITPSRVAASDGRYANRVQVRWSDEASAEDGYRIYRRGPADEDYELVGSTGPNAEVFDDFDVSPGDAYSFCVASFLGNDETDTNPLGESGRACDTGYTPPNGTISGQIATGEGAGVSGSPVCLAPGPDQAVMFDGLGGHGVVPDIGVLPTAFTLEAWANPDDPTVATSPVVTLGSGPTLRLHLLGSGTTVRPTVTSSQGNIVVATSEPFAPGWLHLAATYDGSQLAFYVNGEPVGTPVTALMPSPLQGAFQIGRDLDGNTFDGRLDDIRLWSKALTATEVESAFDAGRPLAGDEVGLYAYWALDQGTGRILTDLTSGGRHAQLEGGAEWTREAAPLNTCALTTVDGNYTFSGLRYGNSTSFSVTPTDPTRQFTPAVRTATLTPESPTENQLDFTDTSAFTVRGRVVHAVDQTVWPGQAPLPAAEIDILVDGTVAGTTESDGTFAVAVRGSREHVFEARAQGIELVFTASYDGQAFADGTAEITTTSDLGGVLFTNTTGRELRGRAAGGCERPIGDLTFRIYSEDRFFDQTFVTAGSAPYALPLPPLAYRLEYTGIGTLPGTLDRADVVDYFRNLGVLQADLSAEADTVDFRYRAPITLVVEGLDDPSPTCAATGYTLVDAESSERQTLPNVPIIGEYGRVPLVIRAYEDYGDGNECAVDEGTVRIFDGFADAAGTPVEVTLTDGEAMYETFGRSPDTFSGRTVGGVDRSYQKSLTAVLEVPDGPTVTETVWAYVEGYREKPATFITATMSEIPVMILRDPPGTESSAFVEEGSTSCTAISQINTFDSAGGIELDLNLGLKTEIGFFASVEGGGAFVLRTETLLGGGVTQTNGPPESNMEVCATTTERWETSGDTGWSSEDLYVGVGLNLIFAEADVVTADPAACTVTLSQALATDIDSADPFETTFVYGKTHIENTLVPRLETLARLAGDGTSIEGEVGEVPVAVTLQSAIDNWEGMIVYNDSLVTEALAGDVENRSFSGGTTYSFGTAVDTTLTSSYESRATFSTDTRFGGVITAGYDNFILGVVQLSTEQTFGRDSVNTQSHGVGYELSDGDTGDYFSVDVARDGRYGTYVFNTLSGASSNPWEANAQKRDLPQLEIDPPIRDGVLEGAPAVFTLSLTNASESNERREYVIDAPPHLNASGAVVKVNGRVLSELRYLVDANQTISIPVTVERGPEADVYDLAIIAYSPFDHEIWRTAPQLGLAVADTARFEVNFTPLVPPVRLVEPEDGWAVNLDDTTVQLTLGDIDIEGTTQEQLGVEFRRPDGAWDTAFSRTGDEIVGTSEALVWTPPVGIADGAYELRAFARRTETGGNPPPPYYGPVATGWIDRTAPLPYGPPEPADVVLALGETIGITFEEPIDCVAFRRDHALTPLAEIHPQTGLAPSLQIGCADRTLLLAPADASLWAGLEGQLVTARLRGVTDLAGNPMAPIPGADAGWDQSWRFTVRRNAFGWTPAVVAVRAQPGVPADLPAALVNGRAQPVTYDLVPHNPAGLPFSFVPVDGAGDPISGGTPVLLTTSALTGTVVAGDVQPVVFRWPGAPIGTYRATLDVHSVEAGEDLGTAALDLTVEVSCVAPDWVANAAAFETSMLLTAELRMAGVASSDPEDLLAAFVDGELRGVAPVDPSTDRVYLTVYGTGAAERIVFQAWDQDTCTLHPTTSQVVEFAANATLGTAASPLVVEAPGAGGVPLEVPLAAGWTWVSTNRAGTSPLASALVGVGASADDVIQSQTGFSQFVPGSGWFGAVTGMDPREGYHIRLSAPATMTHPGAPVDATTPIGLLAGWNWIGYLPASPLPLGDALASVTFAEDDVIKSQSAYAQYVDGVGWLGSLTELAPGGGYQLFVGEDATLTYPAPAASTSAAIAAAAPRARPVRRMDTLPESVVLPRRAISVSNEPTPVLPGTPVAPAGTSALLTDTSLPAVSAAYEHSMILTATLAGAPEGLHVAAYAATEDGEELRGLAPVQMVDALGETRVFLLASGVTGEALSLRPVLIAEGGTLIPTGELQFPTGLPGAESPTPTAATLPFLRDAIVGTATGPVALALSGATATDEDPLPTEVGLSPTRPNPFSTTATFAFGLPTPTAVRLMVYDVLGREVAVLVDEDRAAGLHTVRFDGRALASGTYIARLTAGPEVRTRTFTIAR